MPIARSFAQDLQDQWIVDREVRWAVLHEGANVAHLWTRQQVQQGVQDRGLLRYVSHALGVAFGARADERERFRDHAGTMTHCERGAGKGVGEPSQLRRKSTERPKRVSAYDRGV